MSESRRYIYPSEHGRSNPDKGSTGSPISETIDGIDIYIDSAQDPVVVTLNSAVEQYVNETYPNPTTDDWHAGYRHVLRSGWLDQHRAKAEAYARRKVNTRQRSMFEAMLVQELELGE